MSATLLSWLCKHNGSDKSTDHCYAEVYAALVGSRRESVKHVLEIGVSYGASMQVWLGYFPGATIHGWDITIPELKLPRLQLRVVDQRDRRALRSAAQHLDVKFDLIVDDGCHEPVAQLVAFDALRPFLAVDGYYVVEDLQPGTRLADWAARGAVILDRRGVLQRYDDLMAVYGNDMTTEQLTSRLQLLQCPAAAPLTAPDNYPGKPVRTRRSARVVVRRIVRGRRK